MNIKVKRLVAILCALLLLGVLLAFAQALLLPKYMSDEKKEGALAAEYYTYAGGHDVLFLGDCEAYETFVPAVLWKETGLTSYVRGGPQQLVWHSYYTLADTLRYETPQVVVYNVLALKYGEPQDEAYNRMNIDGLRFSGVKLDCIRASVTDGESFASYLFPLLRYHARWSELSGEDFRYLFTRDRVALDGYLPKTAVQPMGDPGEPPILTDTSLPAHAMEYLVKMADLCRENGIRLILVKAPTNTWKYWWYEEWDQQIAAFAKEQDLLYYNLIPEAEKIGIDWTTDTYDGGVHLNASGAEKTSVYFGALLCDAGIAHRGDINEDYWSGQYKAFSELLAENRKQMEHTGGDEK